MRQVTPTTRVLIALGSGLAIGVAISASHDATLQSISTDVEPIGTLWVNALRMTVIPLVMSAILVGINALPDPRSIGRIGGRALIVCLVILFSSAIFAVVVGPIVLSTLTIDPAAAGAMRESATRAGGDAAQSAQKAVGLAQWFVELVPTNPVKAMADGAMLPLILFTILLGIATTRIAEESREHFMSVVRGVYDASLTLVRWVLVAAPVGVFALSLPLANRLGTAVAGAIVYYIVVVSAMCAAFTGVLYLAVWLVGRCGLRTFARGCAPAQAVAFSARSSLAALPALLEGADVTLRLPLAVRSFFIPLAVVTFRAGAAIAIPIGVLFMAKLYGVHITPAQLMTLVLTTVVTTFSAPGIPGGTIIVMMPVLLAMNMPVAAVGLLLGVDTIPNMFRTTLNVTGDMAAAVLVARFDGDN